MDTEAQKRRPGRRPLPPGERLLAASYSLRQDQHAAIVGEAERLGITTSALVRRAIDVLLDREQERRTPEAAA